MTRCEACDTPVFPDGDAATIECRVCDAPVCSECAGDYDADYDANEESGGYVPSAICAACLRAKENSK